MIREIRFHEKYFIDFYLSLDLSSQEKIEYVFQVIRSVEKIPEKFLKHIEGTDGLYEIRIQFGNKNYRVFCCFDVGKIVILFNGFLKKNQKIPMKEMKKALKLKQEYFDKKKGGNDEKNP